MNEKKSGAMQALSIAHERFMSEDNKERKIFGAYEGFYILQAKTDDFGYPIGAYKEPIIGWEMEDDSKQPIPITPSGCTFDYLDILYPDGTVTNPYYGSFDNINDWLEDEQAAFNRKLSRSIGA